MPPGRIPVSLTQLQVRLLRRAAERISRHRGYSCRSDAWGQGLIADPVFAGLLGEQALCNYLNARLRGLRRPLEVGVDLLPQGDFGTDLEVAGCSFQVKNRRGGDSLLVRRCAAPPRADGELPRLCPLSAQYFVKVSCPAAPGSAEYTSATVDGWATQLDLRNRGVYLPARRGGHMNLELADEFLGCPAALVVRLENRLREGLC